MTLFLRVLKRTPKQCFAELQTKRWISLSSNVNDSFTVQDTKDFEERVMKSKIPVIVDFYATWCNPCRVLAPRIEGVVAENKGKINLAKVNIDDNSDLALDYQVSSIPVLVAINNGKVEGRLDGLKDTDVLKKWIENVLAQVETRKTAVKS